TDVFNPFVAPFESIPIYMTLPCKRTMESLILHDDNFEFFPERNCFVNTFHPSEARIASIREIDERIDISELRIKFDIHPCDYSQTLLNEVMKSLDKNIFGHIVFICYDDDDPNSILFAKYATEYMRYRQPCLHIVLWNIGEEIDFMLSESCSSPQTIGKTFVQKNDALLVDGFDKYNEVLDLLIRVQASEIQRIKDPSDPSACVVKEDDVFKLYAVPRSVAIFGAGQKEYASRFHKWAKDATSKFSSSCSSSSVKHVGGKYNTFGKGNRQSKYFLVFDKIDSERYWKQELGIHYSRKDEFNQFLAACVVFDVCDIYSFRAAEDLLLDILEWKSGETHRTNL
ncbi:hypothetical protein ADUPG1_001936, partial [Aduncisulcus paluster]